MARSFQRPLPPPRRGESPVNDLPPAILLLFLAIAGIEAVLSLAGEGLLGGATGIGWRVAAIEQVAVSPAVLDAALQGREGLWLRFVLYPFVHGGVIHALFAGALLLALGKFVGEAMGQARTLAVFALAGIGGGLVFALALDGVQPLFGAYPGIYGLIGAFTYFLWLRLGRMGENRLGAFRMIGTLLAIQVVFAMIFGTGPQWIGDLGGFVTGGLASVLLAPGGLAALRSRLRAR